MLRKILIGLAALLAVFVIVVALQSPTFRVERSIAIAAPTSDVFPQINDLRKSHVWSPWVKLDPAAKYGFEGPPAGVGASNTWDGNNEVGAGRQTIVESRPNKLVRLKLEFKKPFESTCSGDFTLEPQGNQTVVTWGISGEKNFISKACCLFMNQDKMVGDQFEKGLADLKKLVETAGKKQPIAATQ